MKKVFGKLAEAVAYYIAMYLLISFLINERYRAPLYRMSAWWIFAAFLFAVIKLLLGGEESVFASVLNRLMVLIFIVYAICFAGTMAFNSFGEFLIRLFGA